MIQIQHTDYIVGVWMCEKSKLGKVFIFIIQGSTKDEWIELIKYQYDNQDYNIYMEDNDYRNIIVHKHKSEVEIIKIANCNADEISILFSHTKRKIIIGGNILKYNDIITKNQWLPEVVLYKKSKLKRNYFS